MAPDFKCRFERFLRPILVSQFLTVSAPIQLVIYEPSDGEGILRGRSLKPS
jgi:hypothetical protein